MALSPGTRIGPYEIAALIGAGGMGEVYRADDLKLGQPVALKFLPDNLLSDGAALARFHREVRVARRVSHRNVCRVYDIGDTDGRHFLYSIQSGQKETRGVYLGSLDGTLKREAEGLSHGRHAVTLVRTSDMDLRGSTDYLHSAFSNLVSNAVRYTPEGGRIEISWQSTPDGGARFAVADTGHGIPAEHLPRITERFYRVSTSRSRETGGTGLGLSIVKHVLQLHHGSLTIDSELGVGSTFACVFGPERVLAFETIGATGS